MKYAGFWIRFCSSIIDALISLAVLFPFIAITGFVWATDYNDPAAGVIVFFASWVGGWLYHALFESGTWHIAPGTWYLVPICTIPLNCLDLMLSG
jgi:uncharacterized RDD family membrane protein YckC